MDYFLEINLRNSSLSIDIIARAFSLVCFIHDCHDLISNLKRLSLEKERVRFFSVQSPYS